MHTNYLTQQNLIDLANKNSNQSMSRRRFSLGNFSSQQQHQQHIDTNSQKYSFLQKQQSIQDMFVDQTNFQSTPLYGQTFNESTLSKYLLQQQQQQQQQIQNQENMTNLLKFCSMNPQSQLIDDSPPYSADISNSQNFFPQSQNVSNFDTLSGPLSSSLSSINSSSNLNQNFTSTQNLQNVRRRASYCIGSSQLRPVIESRSSSPVFNQTQQHVYQDQLIQQQQQLLEQKLNLLASSAFLSPPTPTKKFSYSQQNLNQISSSNFRPRAASTGVIESSSLLKSPSSNFCPLAIQNNKHLMENFEEKLATSGNIFQRRENWSILSKLPIAKQNTIHLRLEDEGPFGNDETRCFVLSHLSSLCIKDMNCIFCSCNMVIYDRFPLVDGTLFISPYLYDKNKSIPAIVSNKQQYLNAICLDCLNGSKNHEINCKFCKKSWQSIGAYSLQIGNLYKYDIFAAFPCCQQRLTCLKCNSKVADLETVNNEYFSYYSEEKECPQCKTKAYHFIKPLKSIYNEYVVDSIRRDDEDSASIKQE